MISVKIGIALDCIILFLILVKNTRGILFYKEYSKKDCSGSAHLEFYVNNYNGTSNNISYCSDYLDHHLQSVGFSEVNSTHFGMIVFNEKECMDGIFETFYIPSQTCFLHPQVPVGNTPVFIFMSTIKILPFNITTFENTKFSLESQREWIKADIFIDQKCQNKSTVDWESTYIPMTSTPNIVYVGLRGVGIREIKHQVKNRIQKICNETELFQIIWRFNYLQKENLNVSSWIEIASRKLTDDNCVVRSTTIPDIIDIDSEIASYHFSCVSSNVIPTIPPEEFNQFERDYYHWSPSCYDQAFTLYETESDRCWCYDTVCHSDFINKDSQYQVYYEIDENNNCIEQQPVAFNTMKVIGECVSRECGDYGQCFMLIDVEDEAFEDTSFYNSFYVFETCDYIMNHPEIMEDKKRNQRDVNIHVFHIHESYCLSSHTNDNQLFIQNSVLGKCIDGVLHYSLYNNSISCTERIPLDQSKEVTITKFKGDLCLEYSYYSMVYTCIPTYCNFIASYDPLVCNGHGVCIDGICVCEGGEFGGEFCELPIIQEKEDIIPLLIGISIGIPITIIFLIIIICICCCCLFIFCCFVIMVLIFCIFLTSFISLKQKKSLLKYHQLKDFNILLKEQMIQNDETIPHLKINTSLFEISFDKIELRSIIGVGGSGSTV